MGIEVELKGIGELVDELERMEIKADKIISDTLKSAAQPVLKDAQATTVFKDRSGKLRRSLKVSAVRREKDKKYVLVGSFEKEAFYGVFVEYGTSKMAARPFLQPALERNKNEVTAIIAEKLKEALGK